MKYLLIVWFVYHGELIVDRAHNFPDLKWCQEVGERWISNGSEGEFRCILQQDL